MREVVSVGQEKEAAVAVVVLHGQSQALVADVQVALRGLRVPDCPQGGPRLSPLQDLRPASLMSTRSAEVNSQLTGSKPMLESQSLRACNAHCQPGTAGADSKSRQAWCTGATDKVTSYGAGGQGSR